MPLDLRTRNSMSKCPSWLPSLHGFFPMSFMYPGAESRPCCCAYPQAWESAKGQLFAWCSDDPWICKLGCPPSCAWTPLWFAVKLEMGRRGAMLWTGFYLNSGLGPASCYLKPNSCTNWFTSSLSPLSVNSWNARATSPMFPHLCYPGTFGAPSRYLKAERTPSCH